MKAKTIDISKYPQLQLLLWNRADTKIEEEEAFAIYEANWRFVDPVALTETERRLVDRLTRDYGNGCLNV